MITRFDGVLMYTAKRIIKKNVISFANKIIFPTFATSAVDPQESVVAFTYKRRSRTLSSVFKSRKFEAPEKI